MTQQRPNIAQKWPNRPQVGSFGGLYGVPWRSLGKGNDRIIRMLDNWGLCWAMMDNLVGYVGFRRGGKTETFLVEGFLGAILCLKARTLFYGKPKEESIGLTSKFPVDPQSKPPPKTVAKTFLHVLRFFGSGKPTWFQGKIVTKQTSYHTETIYTHSHIHAGMHT